MNTDEKNEERKVIYQYGMVANEVDNNLSEFDVSMSNADGNYGDADPYGEAWLKEQRFTCVNADGNNIKEIPSIPSPYARMHLTDIAFEEHNLAEEDEWENRYDILPDDYRRCISHCLDMFELFFRFKELELQDKGIKIKKIGLVNADDKTFTGHNPDVQRAKLQAYLSVLALYRRKIMETMQDKRQRMGADNVYTFDFNTLYVFKDNKGSIFGSTSPFTGFFTKQTCDLSSANLTVKWTKNNREYEHKLLTAKKEDWLPLSRRDPQFCEFMFILLNSTGLRYVFENLWESVKRGISCYKELKELEFQLGNINRGVFADKYPWLNFWDASLPKIANTKYFLRTPELDATHLKYMLYLHYNEVETKISEDEYTKEIKDRCFPNNISCQWLSVNDLLSESLFILPYEINEKYTAIPYTIEGDPNRTQYRRCLLPIKKSALEYLGKKNVSDLKELAENIIVLQRKRTLPDKTDEIYYEVTLKVKVEGLAGGQGDGTAEIKLRREYRDKGKHKKGDSQGIIVGPNELEYFAFGVYPFVKSNNFENIYKVLFYNKFNVEIQHEDGFKLSFSYFRNGNIESFSDTADVRYNCTYQLKGIDEPKQPFNSVYYNVEKSGAEADQNGYPSIDFVEVAYKYNGVNATSLIVPNLKRIDCVESKKADIAIDLGTSNTYVAYKLNDDNGVSEITSKHGKEPDSFNELVFMNIAPMEKQRKDFSFKEKYALDLYLPPVSPVTSEDKTPAWTVCMPAQLCEFIPARIVKSNERDYGFSFPIPTIINNHSKNNTQQIDSNLPMIHSAIPFAYYDIGWRDGRDNMSEENFKWFLNDDGTDNNNKLSNFKLFVNELMFLIRTHLLCEGTNLSGCRLAWTYPISFERTLVEKTTEVWKASFKKHFGQNDIANNMFNFNESLSPYYSLSPDIRYNLLIDIGGGTTDVVGYKDKSPLFVSSFRFAGDALYMDDVDRQEGNRDMDQKGTNIIRKQLEENQDIQNLFKEQSESSYFKGITNLISMNKRLRVVMNYGFTKFSDKFERLFRNDNQLLFLTMFHNSAIIYHIAQLCYTKNNKEMPNNVYMSGNGSKLFLLLQNEEWGRNLVRRIFFKYFGEKFTEEWPIKILSNPKQAAAVGALALINSEKRIRDGNVLKTDQSGGEKKEGNIVYTYGDLDLTDDKSKRLHIYEAESTADNYNSDSLKGITETMYENLRTNVRNFIELFYDVVETDMRFNHPGSISKEWMINRADQMFNDKRFPVPKIIKQSHFFMCISYLLEQISREMARSK